MNADRPTVSGTDQYRALQILDELSNNDSLTQRDLSGRMGIALGLVNSYIKNLAKKGYITVTAIPPKRYAYFLTPKGFAEKTRLTYDLLHDYTRIYREARENLKRLFHGLSAEGVKKMVFAGSDEIAEIAYLTLQETPIELVGVVDGENAGNLFFGKEIKPLGGISRIKYDCIVITAYLKRQNIYHELLDSGAAASDIKAIFPL
jgi:DNA-binding MarR family transcriptional regulator